MFPQRLQLSPNLSVNLQVHRMQWKGRTSLLSGTTFLMIQLALYSMSLLRVMEVTHLLGGGLGLVT